MLEPSTTEELDLERLVLITREHTAFQPLWRGVELGLYSLLFKKPGPTFSAIAKRLGLDHQPARSLFGGLTSVRVLRKDGEGYFNAHLTDHMLVRERPGSASPILGWQTHIVYPGLTDFVQSLRGNRNVGLRQFPGPGNALYERLTQHSYLKKVFQ